MTSPPHEPLRKVGRPRQWEERTLGAFAAGTFSRIKAVLADGEDRSAFLRVAVERELQRRERDDPNVQQD